MTTSVQGNPTPASGGTPIPVADPTAASGAIAGSASGAAPEGQASATPEPQDDAGSKKESASSAFAAIAKEKKRALQMQKELKEREAKLAERERMLESTEGKGVKKPSNPIEALQAAGWSYEDATNFVLNNQALTPEQQIKALRDEMTAKEKAQEDRAKKESEERVQAAKAEEERIITEYKTGLSEFLTGNTDAYELINLHEAQELVFETVQAHFDKTKKALTMKEAADAVESYLEEMVSKATQTKKLQAKLRPKAEPDVSGEKPDPAIPSVKTLANAVTNAPAGTNSPARTEQDRRERALRALEAIQR